MLEVLPEVLLEVLRERVAAARPCAVRAARGHTIVGLRVEG